MCITMSKALSPTAMLFLGELKAHPARMLLGLIVICIGVAMGYAVHLINRSALNEFSQAVQSLTGNADLEIRGPRLGFEEHVYVDLARLSEVEAASPLVEVDAKIPGQKETLRILGID